MLLVLDSRTCTRGWEASPSAQVFLHSNQDQSLQWTLCPHWYFSVAKSCLILCDYMFGNKIGFPVFHYFAEFPQTHVFESVMTSHNLILLFPLLCPQSFPASGSLPKSWVFTSDGLSVGASSSASVLPLNITLPLPKQNSCFQTPDNFEH